MLRILHRTEANSRDTVRPRLLCRNCTLNFPVLYLCLSVFTRIVGTYKGYLTKSLRKLFRYVQSSINEFNRSNLQTYGIRENERKLLIKVIGIGYNWYTIGYKYRIVPIFATDKDRYQFE